MEGMLGQEMSMNEAKKSGVMSRKTCVRGFIFI